MTLKEMKYKVLSLIEELNPESELLSEDPDIQAKINSVINQIQYELSRIKKIPAKYEYDTRINKTLEFKDIPNFYQLNQLSTSDYEINGDMEINFKNDEHVIIYYYKYPEKINIILSIEESQNQDDEYEFELTDDVLEIAPDGIAAELLKNDMISGYGRYYYERYNEMKQKIDPRNSSGIIIAEGGLDI